jgi:RHS repeat-associated protein
VNAVFLGHVAVGHPVDVATGEFFETCSDLSISGMVPLVVDRHYRAAIVAAASPLTPVTSVPDRPGFGYGWRAGWDVALRRTLDGFVYTMPNGAELAATIPTGAALTPGARFFAPQHGIEIRVVDAKHVRVIGYLGGRGRHSLVFAVRPDGIAYDLVAIERNAQARLDFHRDADGRAVRLRQSREGKALDVRYADERIARIDLALPDGTSRLVAEYAYDARGLLVEMRDRDGVAEAYQYDAAGRMVRKELRGGSTYTIRYDARGRCVYVSGSDRYQERVLTYDAKAKRTRVRNSHGETTTYEWNDRGQVTRVTSPLKNVVTTQYDALGRPLLEKMPAGGAIEHEYDARGRRVRRTLPGGVTERYVYDDEHRLVLFEDNGRHIEAAYDADGNVISLAGNGDPAWRYEYTPFGERSRVTNPVGESRWVQRDGFGNPVAESNYAGAAWTHTYNAYGQRTSTTDPIGRVTRIDYDDRERPSVYVARDGTLYRRTYDLLQKSVTTHGPNGRWEALRYSSCNQLVEAIDSSGYATRFHWGSEPSELRAIENTRGERAEFLRDAEGRVVEKRSFDGRVTRYEHGAEFTRAVIDAAGERTEYEYDERGNLVKRVAPDGESTYEYDDASRLVSATTPESAMALKFDARGVCIEETVEGVTIERAFDALGRATSLKTSLGDHTTFAWNPEASLRSLGRGGVMIHFERDAVGREVRRRMPVGDFEQSYDAGGRLATQGFRGAATAADASAPPSLWRTFAYDPFGRPEEIVDSLRGPTRFRHDDRGALRAVIRPQGEGSEFYDVDGEGNRLLVARSTIGDALEATLLQAGVENLHAIAPSYATEVATAHLSRGNRLERIESHLKSIEYEYDARGCVVRKTVTEGEQTREWRFAWNARTQLTRATLPDGSEWAYRYDPCGRRIEKKGPDGSVQRFVWDSNRILHVLEGGERKESFAYLPATTSPVLRETDRVQYVIPDASGALSELVERDGTIHGGAKGAWGEGYVGPDGCALQPLRAQWKDAETGLHYNVYRYYDPDTGRFLSPDPVGIKGGLNLYVAVTSPVVEADDWGLVRTGQTDFPGGADRTRQGSRDDTITVKNRSGDDVETQKGGVKTDDGSVSLRGNTACDRYDNGVDPNNFDDTKPSYTTLNGRPDENSEAMHAEMRGMQAANSPSTVDQLGAGDKEEPVVFVISRAPCERCDAGLPDEAQKLADATGRSVHIYYPPYEEDEEGNRKPNKTFDPKCGG